MPMLDKWYIRRTLRRDWCALLEQLCDTTQADYRNARRNIDYRLTLLPPAAHATPQ